MTLSAQQFNKIAMKEDLLKLESKFDLLDEKFSRFIDSVDGLVYMTHNLQCEFAANQSAHDRFESRLNSVKGELHLTPIF